MIDWLLMAAFDCLNRFAKVSKALPLLEGKDQLIIPLFLLYSSQYMLKQPGVLTLVEN